MKKYTIEDASKGEVSIKNDGTYEQITVLLSLAFPNDRFRFFPTQDIATAKFFSASPNLAGRYFHSYETDLPTQSVKDFLTPEWKPERGEMVSIGGLGNRIFLAEIKGSIHPYIAVDSGDEDRYYNGCTFRTIGYTEIKQIETPEPKQERSIETIEVNVTLNGQNINPMRFSRRAWGKIRTNQ